MTDSAAARTFFAYPRAHGCSNVEWTAYALRDEGGRLLIRPVRISDCAAWALALWLVVVAVIAIGLPAVFLYVVPRFMPPGTLPVALAAIGLGWLGVIGATVVSVRRRRGARPVFAFEPRTGQVELRGGEVRIRRDDVVEIQSFTFLLGDRFGVEGEEHRWAQLVLCFRSDSGGTWRVLIAENCTAFGVHDSSPRDMAATLARALRVPHHEERLGSVSWDQWDAQLIGDRLLKPTGMPA